MRPLGQMVERVMILDAVLGDRRCWWLSPEADKRRFFGLKRESWLQPEDYPHIACGLGRQRTIRCFPDKLPIGIGKDSNDRVRHSFAFGVTDRTLNGASVRSKYDLKF